MRDFGQGSLATVTVSTLMAAGGSLDLRGSAAAERQPANARLDPIAKTVSQERSAGPVQRHFLECRRRSYSPP